MHVANRFVTFRVGERVYAVDMAPVQEIVPLPNVTEVPLAPSSVLGFANLRGEVLPVVSLRRALDFQRMEDREDAQVIVFREPSKVGLVVDQVLNVVAVSQVQREEVGVGNVVAGENGLIRQILKDVDGEDLVAAIDVQNLVTKELEEFGDAVGDEIARYASGGEVADSEGDTHEESLRMQRFAIFDLGGQSFALDVQHVREIVQFPENVTPFDDPAAHVLGLAKIRGRTVPLFSLRSLLGFPRRTVDEDSRVIVVNHGAVFVGLVADSVSEVLELEPDALEEVPPVAAADEKLPIDVTHVFESSSAGKLISVIDLNRFLRENQQAFQDTFGEEMKLEHEGIAALDAETDSEAEQTFVSFRLSDTEFVVRIEDVQEIVRVPSEITPLPGAPDFVDGLANLRGHALPIVDLRTRFGMRRVPHDEDCRVVVLTHGGLTRGYVVDEVTEILKVPASRIQEAPSESNVPYVDKVLDLADAGRLALLVNVPTLMSDESSQDRVSTDPESPRAE